MKKDVRNAALFLVISVTCLHSTLSSSNSSFSVQRRPTDAEIRHTLKTIIDDTYDKRIRPNVSGTPVAVAIDFSTVAFSEVQEVNMAYTMDMFFRQVWIDPRLRHNLTTPITLTMGTGHPADYIWVPDTVFENAFTAHLHGVLVSNHKIDISPDGQVFWGTRVTVKAMCHMDLRRYPLDVQQCALKIVSYAYTGTDLTYEWRSNPGVVFLDRDLAQFFVTDVKTEAHTIIYVAGSYSVLEAKFLFKRRLGYYIIQIYIPCIFIVLISTMSFWVDKNATPARIGLSITTLLTISTLWGSLNSTMPRVSYPKAIDWYLMVSFAFVFSSLVEYIAVLHLHKLRDKVKKTVSIPAEINNFGRAKHSPFCLMDNEENLEHTKVHKRQQDNGRVEMAPLNGVTSNGYGKSIEIVFQDTDSEQSCCKSKGCCWALCRRRKSSTKRNETDKKASLVDVYSRVLFPVVFGAFNIIYWMRYLHDDPDNTGAK